MMACMTIVGMAGPSTLTPRGPMRASADPSEQCSVWVSRCALGLGCPAVICGVCDGRGEGVQHIPTPNATGHGSGQTRTRTQSPEILGVPYIREVVTENCQLPYCVAQLGGFQAFFENL